MDIQENASAASAANDTSLSGASDTPRDSGGHDMNPRQSGASSETPAPLFSGKAADEELGALYDEISATAPPEELLADQPKAERGEPEKAIDAPGSWSAEMKASWSKLPPEARTYIAQRESEAHTAISRMGQELSSLRPLGELQSRYQTIFDRNGVTFEDGFSRLMAAQDLLEKNPVRGIAAIAETFGVDLHNAFGANQGDPEVSRLQQEISQLKAVLNDQQREGVARQMAEQRSTFQWAEREVFDWSHGKEHYDAVRGTMAKIVQAGLAAGLDEAYELAIQKHPDIRSKVEAARRAAEAGSLRKRQEAEATAARKAARTTIGNRAAKPSPGGHWDDPKYLSSLHDSIAGQAT